MYYFINYRIKESDYSKSDCDEVNQKYQSKFKLIDCDWLSC